MLYIQIVSYLTVNVNFGYVRLQHFYLLKLDVRFKREQAKDLKK